PLDERPGGARPRGPVHVPDLRGDNPEPADAAAEPPGRHLIRLASGFEPTGGIGAQGTLEQIRDTRVPQLSFLDLRDRVRERGEPESFTAQPFERRTDVGMSRKLADRRQDGGLVCWREGNRAPGGGDGQRRAEMLPEPLVRSRDRREQRALQPRLEPLDAYPRVAENAREVRFERGQIEERFVHVEDKDVFHDRRRGWDSNPRSFRLRTFQVRALGQLGDLSDHQEWAARCAAQPPPDAQGWLIRAS